MSLKFDHLTRSSDTKQTSVERSIDENYAELENGRVFEMSSKTLKIRQQMIDLN